MKKAIDATQRFAVLHATGPMQELLLSLAWLLAESRRLRDAIAVDLGPLPPEPELKKKVDDLAAALALS